MSAQNRENWHALKPDEVISSFGSDDTRGLATEEAASRLARLGPNALPEKKGRTLLSVFVGQFKSPLIYLLFAAGGIALALGHLSDAIVIFVVVFLNAIIGAFQEGRAERALQSLRALSSHKAHVTRDGRECVIEAREVVPGDILILEAGDAIAADARLLQSAVLQVAEAALTGESLPVAKSLLALTPDTALADRKNMVYSGTHVTAGRARAVVVATGLGTEIGHIAALTESAEQPKTPLERRIDRFGRSVIIAAAVLFALVNVVGLLRGMDLADIVMISISQVVGMIPEGLPVAMTIALAVGVQRMARRQAVVRRLAAVETLGSTTIICSDKTGTLTKNEMTVTTVWLPGDREVSVTGIGYAPAGRLLEAGRDVVESETGPLRDLLEAGTLCNDASLETPEGSELRWRPIGDPTEAALVTLAMKGGIAPTDLRKLHPRLAEIPFDAANKLMATEHQATQPGARTRVILKGAPEVLFGLCGTSRQNGADRDFDEIARSSAEKAAERMAAQALRVLALGVAEDTQIGEGSEFGAFAGRVTFLGLVGQLDPPRPEVEEAVLRCRLAGIRPVMVTGDHKATGQAIAAALGIARDGEAAVDGAELSAMSDEELKGRIDQISVFARVHPAQKLRIVAAYQSRNEVVAMTGDGVNDAPALVQADVGVAMGITGTEVAKEAAKIVLRDDNFASIVSAVEEGRVVYSNIKKAVLLLFSTSAAEVLVLLLALMLGFPAPFVAVQILWNNLVTEGLITVNLIMEPAEGTEMEARPVSPDEPLLSRLLLTRMAFMVPAIVLSTLGWFIVRMAAGVPEAQVRTETFTLLAICEWFNVLNCRSESKSALSLSVLNNPWLLGGLILGNLLQAAVVFWAPLSHAFHTVPFDFNIILALGLVGSLVLWVEELRKLWVRMYGRRDDSPKHEGTR